MNIMLIVIDTLRADHLGCYGYFRNTSPTMDQLAKEGVLFLDAHATAIATGPAFTSIITGLSPVHHHFYVTPHNIPNLAEFDDTIPTLAEMIWKKGGYTTAAFDNLMCFASPMKHLVRGFEYYVDVTGAHIPEAGPATTIGARVNRQLLPWIREHIKENFFLFVHYWEPHTPYNQPKEYRHIFHHEKGNLSDLKIEQAEAGYSYVPGWGEVNQLWEEDKERKPAFAPITAERTIDLYDGEIRYVDDLLKQVLETLKSTGILEKTLIIIVGDHGEQLGQHNFYGHHGLHESVIRVPLIFWNPQKLSSNRAIRGYVQHADIMPTILDLIGSTNIPCFDGQSLVPLIMGKTGGREEIFIENYEQRALLQRRWKYIRDYISQREALYNLKEDPVEIINCSERYPQRLKAMRSQLDGWVKKNLSGAEDPLQKSIRKWREQWQNFLKRPFPVNDFMII